MTKPRKPGSLEERISLWARRRAAGKRAYARADTLFEEISKDMKVGQSVGGWKLVDNYANKNKVYRPAGVSKLELVEDRTA